MAENATSQWHLHCCRRLWPRFIIIALPHRWRPGATSIFHNVTSAADNLILPLKQICFDFFYPLALAGQLFLETGNLLMHPLDHHCIAEHLIDDWLILYFLRTICKPMIDKKSLLLESGIGKSMRLIVLVNLPQSVICFFDNGRCDGTNDGSQCISTQRWLQNSCQFRVSIVDVLRLLGIFGQFIDD